MRALPIRSCPPSMKLPFGAEQQAINSVIDQLGRNQLHFIEKEHKEYAADLGRICDDLAELSNELMRLRMKLEAQK
jgi:hypothetical protein